MRVRLWACAAMLIAALWQPCAFAASEAPGTLVESIAPQALDAALKSFIAQTHLNLLYVSGVVAGKRSGPVSAGDDPLSALRHLLAGTGLEAQVLTPSTVRIVPLRRRARAVAAPAVATPVVATAAQLDVDTLDELLVTATKREEPLGRIPLSVLVLSPDDIRPAGVGSIADIASASPGFGYSYNTQYGSGVLTHTVLRGISTDKGAPTMGVTLGDTPLQMPTNPFRTPYPLAFDMQRIELLRGPQGTLYGSDSMGGALRYIPATADTRERLLSTWLEGAVNEAHGSGGTGAVTVSAPLVEGLLGLHVALLQSNEPGYVDRVNPFDGSVLDAHANRSSARVAHVALAFEPNDAFRLEPDLFYQHTELHDTPVYYARGYRPALLPPPPDPTLDGSGLRNGKLLEQPLDEQLWQASLKATQRWGGTSLELYGAYFDRRNHTLIDETNGACALFLGSCGSPLGPPYPTSYDQAVATPIAQHQALVALEARLAGNALGGRLSWLGGLSYTDLHTDIDNRTFFVVDPTNLGILELNWYVVRQLAAYGTVRYALTPRWSVGAGTRIGQMEGESTVIEGGFTNPDVIPYRHWTTPWSSQKADPRFDIGFQRAQGQYFYLSAAKGTREGSTNSLHTCHGVADPDHYGSDAVWSYELGAKLADTARHLRLNGSVFYIRWNGVQDQIQDACGNSFTANTGSAISQGFDLDADWSGRHWGLQAALGYVDAHYSRDVFDGSGKLISLDGAALGGFPSVPAPWSGRLQLAYRTDDGYYAKAEGRFQTRNPGPFTGMDPRAAEPLPAYASPDPGIAFFGLQLGRAWGPWELRVVVENLTDRQPQVQPNIDYPGSPLVYASSYAPRSYHLRLGYQR